MRIALFYQPSPGTVGEYFHSALVQAGQSVEHFALSDADRCTQEYDVYLRIDHGYYSQNLPERFHPKAFYVVDTHLNRSWKNIRRVAPGYDVVFCVQRSASQRLPRAHWVPLGCDPAIHGTTESLRKTDLAFVGNDGGVPRKFLLQELRERYPNSFIGQAPHTQMSRIYGQSKIGFHYIECTSPLKDHISMRAYEVLASGTMLMANGLATGTFESLGLRDRKELVVYHSPEELFTLLDYYLKHDAEREQIAQAGQRCVLQEHTYRHRAEKIVEILTEKLRHSRESRNQILASARMTEGKNK